MYSLEDVAVFWDYENCPIPSNTSGYSIVDNIRSIARPYGSVKSFKAYLEISDQAQRSMALRSELQSSGVSLVDCPHNGRKDVADKMIIVDMFAHAIDTPAPSTVVLITGDRDFAYAISTLRLRMYRVVLVTLSNAHASLTAQASVCLDWNCHVLAPSEASMKTSTTNHLGQGSSSTAQEKSRQFGMPNFGGDWLEVRQNNETGFVQKIHDATNERLASHMLLNSSSTGAQGKFSKGPKERLYVSANSTSISPSSKPFTPTLGPSSVVKTLVNTPNAGRTSPSIEKASLRDQPITPITSVTTGSRDQPVDPPDSNEPFSLKEENDPEDLFVQPLFNQSVPADSSLSTYPGSSSSTVFLPSILTGSSSRSRFLMPSKTPAQPPQPASTASSNISVPTYRDPDSVSSEVVVRPVLPSANPLKLSPNHLFVSPKAVKMLLPQPTFRTSNNVIPASQQRSSSGVVSSDSFQSVAAPSPNNMTSMSSYASFDPKIPYSVPAFGALPRYTAPVSKPTNGNFFTPFVPSQDLYNNGIPPPLPTSAFSAPLSPLPAPVEYTSSTDVKRDGLVLPPQRAATVLSSYTTGQALPILATSSPATATSLPPSSPVALNLQTSAVVAQEASPTIRSESTSDFVYYSRPSSPISARAFQRIEPAVDIIGTDDITFSPPARPHSLPNPILYPVENDFAAVSPAPQQPVPLPENSSSISSNAVNGSPAERPSLTDAQLVPLMVPENFRILVQCLQTHRSKGILQPLRTKVSVEISQNGATYRKAGVQKFGQYVALAEEMGIIELGGWEGAAWIRLKPDWQNAKFSASVEVGSLTTPSAEPKSPSHAVSCTHSDTPSSTLPLAAIEKSNGAELSFPKPVSVTLLQPADTATKPSDDGDDHVPLAQSALLADDIVTAPDTAAILISPIVSVPPAVPHESAGLPAVAEMTFSGTSTPAIAASLDRATPNVIPEIFKILVQCLQSHRSKGVERPFRTDIAMELNEDKSAYAKAGVTRFGEYTALAEQQGVIELGGREGGAWIRLSSAHWPEDIPSAVASERAISSTPVVIPISSMPLGQASSQSAVTPSRKDEEGMNGDPTSESPAPASQPQPIVESISDDHLIPSVQFAPSSNTTISSPSHVASGPISPKPSQSRMALSTQVSSSSVVVEDNSGHTPVPVPLAMQQPVAAAPPIIVPEIFKPLVGCLQAYKSKGTLKPFRTNVAIQMNKNKATYRKAGVDRFGPYTTLAEERGIIELGGKEGGAWMALKPKWYDAVAS